METMKAVVFRGVNDLQIEAVPKPRPGPGEAVIRVTATTICGTDVHIVNGEYAVRPGLILGHEPVGVIEELFSHQRDRVMKVAIYPHARPVAPEVCEKRSMRSAEPFGSALTSQGSRGQ